MSVKQCMEEVDSAEFARWQVVDSVSPIGEHRLDYHSALLRWTLVALKARKGHKPKIKNFFVDFWAETIKPTTEQIQERVHMFFTMLKNMHQKKPTAEDKIGG